MTQEEKAKAYDEALVKLQEAKVDDNVCDERYCCVIDNIVPELQESEDERVRKEIIYHIKNCDDTIDEDTEKRMITWLEKQSKKSKVEQAMREVEEKADAFTEAHKGQASDEILAQMRGEQKPYGQRKECTDCQFNYAGECKGYCAIKRSEQNPAWSDEDKRIIDNLISQLGNLYARKLIKEETKDKYVNWLKSLRPQNRWKPSDEQIQAVKEAACYSSVFSEKTIDNLISLSKQLKKLK